MRINIANWDRVIRFFLGTTMVAWEFAGGPIWAYVGLAILATAAWRFDPFYAIFRTGTAKND